MALIKCPDCQKEHSDSARACPNCGRPAAHAVTLIEATGKRYKGMQAAGIVGVLIGVIAAVAGGGGWAALVMFLSFVLYAVGRYKAWWHHR